MKTIKQAIYESVQTLDHAGISESRLEAEILLSHVMGISRTELNVGLEDSISPEQAERFDQLVHRRTLHEPIAYLTGYKEFFGLDFVVNASTLIPRPETELLVETALKWAANARPAINLVADVGSGCGAIAISLAVHMPRAEFCAMDTSIPALEVAATNCKRHCVQDRVHTLFSDLLKELPQPVNLIVANLPYISESMIPKLETGILQFEPYKALNGGPDGLDLIRQLLVQAPDHLRPGGAIMLEISPEQQVAVTDLARNCFPSARTNTIPDLSGSSRVIVIEN